MRLNIIYEVIYELYAKAYTYVSETILLRLKKHNDVSEAKGRVNGVVHHCEGAVVEGMVRFRIDVGSAGVVFIRKLLKTLAKYPEVKEVAVDL